MKTPLGRWIRKKQVARDDSATPPAPISPAVPTPLLDHLLGWKLPFLALLAGLIVSLGTLILTGLVPLQKQKARAQQSLLVMTQVQRLNGRLADLIMNSDSQQVDVYKAIRADDLPKDLPARFAATDMLNRFTSQPAAAWLCELHATGQGQEEIRCVYRHQGRLILGRWPTSVLADILSPSGAVGLRQASGGQDRIRLGNTAATLPVEGSRVHGTDWTLVAVTATPAGWMPYLLPAALAGAAGLVLGTLLVGLHRRTFIKTLDDDSKIIVSMIHSPDGQPASTNAPHLLAHRKILSAIPHATHAPPHGHRDDVQDVPTGETEGAPTASESTSVQAEADADTTHPSVTQLPIEERLILQGNEMIGLYGAGLLDTDLQALVQLLLAATEGSDSPVLLGRDGRFSSPLLHKTALKALTDAGRDVADMGLCPAPALAFMIASGSFSEGLMISGGHRPGTFNAVRIFANGQPIYIERSALDVQRNQPPRSADRPGKIDSIADPMAAYTQAFCQDIVLAASPRILVDCANGVAGLFIKPLYESLGLEVKLINHPLDGDFPAHETPDPSWHSNLKELAEAVRQEAADIGVMFDSDGRRFGVVDASGNFISSDRLMLLHSSDILSRHPGASIVVEQNTTRSLHEAILHNGGRLELAAPGIWHLHEQLQGNAAMLAGNRKGDMIFADRWPGIQDGIYAFARTLEYLSNYNLDLGEALEGWPEMPRRVAARYNVPDQSLSTVMLQLADADWGAHFRPTSADSLRLEASEGWALLEPDRERRQLLLVCEAVDEAALETLVASITSLLKPLMETLRIKEI